ncbi:hypothetical protein EDD85DRAFT_789690 [Armillaria nabsnona]|nr:hypothetical protein EDD85DRAFT_789690 [Armillaria nabsnona]
MTGSLMWAAIFHLFRVSRANRMHWHCSMRTVLAPGWLGDCLLDRVGCAVAKILWYLGSGLSRHFRPWAPLVPPGERTQVLLTRGIHPSAVSSRSVEWKMVKPYLIRGIVEDHYCGTIRSKRSEPSESWPLCDWDLAPANPLHYPGRTSYLLRVIYGIFPGHRPKAMPVIGHAKWKKDKISVSQKEMRKTKAFDD